MNAAGQMPSTIRIVTTSDGREACESHLFDNGKFSDFLNDFCLKQSEIRFGKDDILVPRVADDDHVTKVDNERRIKIVRTEVEAQLFLELCIDEAFKLSSQPDMEVIFLVAGGTANMCACLTIAAQFYGKIKGERGRKKHHIYNFSDRICHVYVEPREMERDGSYYYPTPDKPSTVKLVELPLLSVRNKFLSRDFDESASYFELLTGYANRTRKMILHTKEHVVEWSGITCKLESLPFVLFYFLCKHRILEILPNLSNSERKYCSGILKKKNDDLCEEIIKFYRDKIQGKKGIGIELSFDNIKSYISRVRKDFSFFFGPNNIIRDMEPKFLNIQGLAKPKTYYGFQIMIGDDDIEFR